MTPRARARRAFAAVVGAGVVAAACSGGGISGDQGRLTVEGSATVTEADGDTVTVTDDAELELGDVVVVDEGTATLELADGSRYRLRAADRGGAASELVMAIPPELVDGDVLVDDGFPAQISVDVFLLTARGALAVDADAATARAYEGRARVVGIADLDELPALRMVTLSEEASLRPLDYDGSDPWDRRYLAEAISFGERLESLARGYTSELQPGVRRSASFFEAIIPALDEAREFNDRLLDEDRPVGETLIGAAIAVQGREGTFLARWEEIFAFRGAGAVWGLVALDQGVSSAPLLETIELALAESPLSDDPRPTTTTETTTTTTTAPGPGSTTTTSTTTTTTPEDPDDGVADPVVDPVEEIVADLLEALGLGSG